MFRASVTYYPMVYGTGSTEEQALSNFLDEFEDWGRYEHKSFSKWYKRNSRELKRWANEDVKVEFVDVNFEIKEEDGYIDSGLEQSSESSLSTESCAGNCLDSGSESSNAKVDPVVEDVQSSEETSENSED